MKRQILVPLDGSVLSETVLPQAVTLARLTSSELVLLRSVMPPHMVEPISAAAVPPASTYEMWEAETQEAHEYMDRVAAHLRSKGVIAQVVISEDDPATAIVTYAQSPTISIIAMATHGRSGLRRWVFGSVAERVLQAAPKALLLVRPEDSEHIKQAPPIPDQAVLYRKIILPLDGSTFAEQALGWAQALTAASGAQLCLMTVVPSDKQYRTVAEKEGVTPAVAAGEQAQVERMSRYLKETTLRLQAAWLNVDSCVIEGHPAEAIIQLSEQSGADMIVMATHGRGGLQRMWMGSIAQKVVQGASIPVLLVRAKEQ